MKPILGSVIKDFILVLLILTLVGIVLSILAGTSKTHPIATPLATPGTYSSPVGAAVSAPAVMDSSSVHCVDGFKMLSDGHQLLNEHGGGIPCP